MQVRITFRPRPASSAEPGLFSDVFERRQAIWPSLLASAMVHGVGLALLPILVEALSGINYVPVQQTTYRLEPFRLELPNLDFPEAHPRKAKVPEPKPATERHSPRQNEAGAQPAPQPRPRAPIPRQFELPKTPYMSERAPVILQQDLVMLPPPPLPAAPPLAFWSRAGQHPLRRTFTPGSAQTTRVAPKLDAPPVLGPSNLQPTASDIAATLAAVQAAPKLPLPNSSTNPVRMPGQSAADIASFDAPRGDPLNLIYLGADNTAATHIEIPRGVQNTPRSDGPAGTATTARHAPEDAEKPAANATAAPDRATPGAASTARVPIAQSAAGTATAARTPSATANSAAPGTVQQKAAANSPQDTSPTAAAKASDHPPAATTAHSPDPGENGVIRMTHPSNGNFDVVILQSVARDGLPAVGATLSGNPVYTVYLSVGDAREWLLEYCIPASANPRTSGFMVNIDDPGVISAPYPLSTAIPKSILDLPHPQHIVFRGLLSAAGALHEVKPVSTDNALIRDVLSMLSQWQFRPALRNKVPVEVEILLIVPPRN